MKNISELDTDASQSLFPVIVTTLFSFSDAARGKDAVRLGAFSFSELEQRIPNSCLTKEGQKCVFPFKYKGQI